MDKKILPSQAKSSKEEAVPSPCELSKTFKIDNELGLHARAAAQFVKIASRYRSEIKVQKDSREVNGKSIMGILTLAAAKGSKIRITTIGEDSSKAMDELGALIDNKFGEK